MHSPVHERGRRAVASELGAGEDRNLLVVRVACDGARDVELAQHGAREGRGGRPDRVGRARTRRWRTPGKCGGGLAVGRVLGPEDVLERLRR
jgi:hypothetical protein